MKVFHPKAVGMYDRDPSTQFLQVIAPSAAYQLQCVRLDESLAPWREWFHDVHVAYSPLADGQVAIYLDHPQGVTALVIIDTWDSAELRELPTVFSELCSQIDARVRHEVPA